MDWYEQVDPSSSRPITQGDIVFDCPLIGWQPEADLSGSNETEVLMAATFAVSGDVVILSQACDLKHYKVPNLILCTHNSLSEYKSAWEQEMAKNRQNPTPKAWKSHCDDVCDGYIWNLTMLNSFEFPDSKIDIRIVNFHDIFTVPRKFLECLLLKRNQRRFRLLPPYREHLFQAFARFFMRVGLPVSIDSTW